MKKKIIEIPIITNSRIPNGKSRSHSGINRGSEVDIEAHLRVEREWHDEHFLKKQKGQRWFGTHLRAWLYSPQIAGLANIYLRALIPNDISGQNALDYGCGLEGNLWEQLVSAGAMTYAFDISHAALMIQQGKTTTPGMHFLTAAAEQLPFSDDAFDVVVGESILHHLELEPALWELRRVLKPGGIGIWLMSRSSAPSPGLR